MCGSSVTVLHWLSNWYVTQVYFWVGEVEQVLQFTVSI